MRGDFRIIIIFLSSAVLTGVIGNRADYIFVKFLPKFLSQPVKIQAGWLYLFAALSLAFPSIMVIRYKAALKNVSNLNKIGDKLANNILALYQPIPNRSTAERNARDVANILFQDITKDRPFDQCGIAIYLPNSTRQYLNAWQWYSTPNHASDTVAFYIGNDDGPNNPSNERGVIGTTFRDEETRIVRFNRDGSADTNLYLPYGNGRPGYRSFICEAIYSSVRTPQGIERRTLGVLCLYSVNRGTFDNSGIRVIIKSLAYRFSVVLMSFS